MHALTLFKTSAKLMRSGYRGNFMNRSRSCFTSVSHLANTACGSPGHTAPLWGSCCSCLQASSAWNSIHPARPAHIPCVCVCEGETPLWAGWREKKWLNKKKKACFKVLHINFLTHKRSPKCLAQKHRKTRLGFEKRCCCFFGDVISTLRYTLNRLLRYRAKHIRKDFPDWKL